MKIGEGPRLLLLFVLLIRGGEGGKHEKSLRESLFNSSYDREVRPVDDDADAVQLVLDVELFQIVKLNEKDQTIEVSAWLRQTWYDHTLVWNPKDYGNITQINVNPDKVWLPDTVLYNSVIEDNDVGGHLDKLHTRIIIHHNGAMQWTAIAILKTHCNIRVSDFPFDTQECSLKFTSWTHGVHLLKIRTKQSKMDTKNYLSNSEWHLVSTNASSKQTKYDCCEYNFDDITFSVTVSRRSSFYICNLVFPISVITLLTILSFLLPAESGERISLAVTLLLSVTVFMLIVADTTPATGEEIPLVSQYFVISMVDMVILMITVCYVNRLHHKQQSDGPMAAWTRKYILGKLSYWVRIQDRKEKTPLKEDSPNNHLLKTINGDTTTNGVVQLHGKNNDKYTIDDYAFTFSPNVSKESQELAHFVQNVGNRINRRLDKLVSKVKDDELDDIVKTEWRIVAMTVDRCLLIFFFINFVATLVGVFSHAPGYVA